MGEITENNKLIAEFMEFKITDTRFHGDYRISVPDEFQEINWDNERSFPSSEENMCAWDAFNFANLKFHESWSWLMLVVEKIERLVDEEKLGSINFVIGSGEVKVKPNNYLVYLGNGYSLGDSKIEAVYNGVIAFVTWYNENVKPEND